MITPNTDFTFIQVKSDNPVASTWQNGTVAEVIEMTTQLRNAKKSSAFSGLKSEDKVGESTVELDNLLLSAVDEVLKHVFKEAGAEVVYSFIENKCHLKREEISEKPEDFAAGLERLLGSAAPVIEKMILKKLYSKFHLKYEEKDGYVFLDCLRELREKCGC